MILLLAMENLNQPASEMLEHLSFMIGGWSSDQLTRMTHMAEIRVSLKGIQNELPWDLHSSSWIKYIRLSNKITLADKYNAGAATRSTKQCLQFFSQIF